MPVKEFQAYSLQPPTLPKMNFFKALFKGFADFLGTSILSSTFQ